MAPKKSFRDVLVELSIQLPILYLVAFGFLLNFVTLTGGSYVNLQVRSSACSALALVLIAVRWRRCSSTAKTIYAALALVAVLAIYMSASRLL